MNPGFSLLMESNMRFVAFLLYPVTYWRERRKRILRDQLASKSNEIRSMGGQAKE